MTVALAERIQTLGSDVRLRTSLREPRVQSGEVRGIVADTPEGPVEMEASAVILATGGFQGNAELLERYVTPFAGRMYLRANPWSTGDGLLAATAVGAALTPNLSAFYSHAIAAPPTRFDEREFQAAGQRYGPVAVALNLAGRRFVDESAGTGEEYLNGAISRQPEATAVYVVDGRTARLSYHGSPTAQTRIGWLRERGGPVVEAGSLEALCTAMGSWGIPASEALQTLVGYNQTIDECPDALSPPRLRNRHPLVEPPFVAMLVRPGITFTAGG
jgi:hypothetical protein